MKRRNPLNGVGTGVMAGALVLAGCSADADAPDDQMSHDEMVEAGLIEGGAPMHGDYDDIDQGTAGQRGFDCDAVQVANASDQADIVGVTIGMTAEAAFERIACSNPALEVAYSSTDGFHVDPLPDGTRPHTLIRASGGQEVFTAWLAGRAGQERVIALRRELTSVKGMSRLADHWCRSLRESTARSQPQRWTATGAV